MSVKLENILKNKFFEKKVISNFDKVKIGLKEIDNKYKNFTGSLYIISDLHLPFKNDNAVKDFFKNVDKDKNKKMFVIAGDMLDMTNFKRWKDTMPIFSISEEIYLGKEFCKLLRNYSKDIIFLFANHEERLYKRLIENLTRSQAEDVIRQIKDKLIDDFLSYDCKIIDNWFIKIGNIGICHPEQNSSTRGKTAVDVCEWFYDRIPQVEIWFLAHTHKQSIVGYKRHFGIETGCLCSTMDYSITPKLMYRNEQQYFGYGYCYLEKGKSNINNCRFINLGMEKGIL